MLSCKELTGSGSGGNAATKWLGDENGRSVKRVTGGSRGLMVEV